MVDILGSIWEERKSGLLVVGWGLERIPTYKENEKVGVYYFKDGQILLAREVVELTEVYRERTFGRLLEEVEDPSETIERFFVSKLRVKKGVFSFIRGVVRYDLVPSLRYTTPDLIMIASRYLDELEVRRRIQSDDLVFQGLPVEPRVKLTEEERKVLSFATGKSVREIRLATELPTLTVLRALYGFLALRLVYPVQSKAGSGQSGWKRVRTGGFLMGFPFPFRKRSSFPRGVM